MEIMNGKHRHEDFGEKIITGQNGDFVLPDRVDRWEPPSLVALVNNIIMNQGSRMHQFDNRSRVVAFVGRDIPIEMTHQQHQNRPQALSSSGNKITDDLIDQKDVRLQQTLELLFEGIQIGFDGSYYFI